MAELRTEDVFGGDTFLTRLCEELEEYFPPINPTPKDDDRLIMFRAGQRFVVEYILDKQEK
jgi:hypothetical protein